MPRGMSATCPRHPPSQFAMSLTGLSLGALDRLIADIKSGSVAPTSTTTAAAVAKTAAAPKKPPAAPKEAAAPKKPAPTAAKPDVVKVKAAAAPQAKAAAAAAAASEKPSPSPPMAPPAGAASDLPATEALYQTDTYLFTATATVLAITPLDGDQGYVVLLDSTCFHPQGGGQPADTGTMTSVDGGAPWAVSMCKKDPAGVVAHQGASAPSFCVGSKVNLVVDESSRVLNARVHSAGHLIDVAMAQAGCTLKATKGYHYTPGAYVEYEGKLEASEREALLPKVQAALDALIAQAVPTIVQSTGGVRVVNVGGQGCPCGGTHVRDTKELGAIKVEAVKSKGKVTRVSYTLP